MAPFSSKKSDTESSGPTKRLFTRDVHNFRFSRDPTINVSSPNCGPSGKIGNLNAISGDDSPAALFPTLTWRFKEPETIEADPVSEKELKTKEYLIIVEDIDSARLTWVNVAPTASLNGVYYGVPAGTTAICPADLVRSKKALLKWITTSQRGLIGGFKYGDADGKVWRVPKSLHRIHFQVIALSKSVDTLELSEHPTRESFSGAVEGKVLGWGEWVGVYEKK